MALWRRLRRLGALSVTGSAYILPATDECVEAFQWLAQEVEHAGGQALLMCTDQFEGRSDQEIVDLFQQARAEEYEPLAGRAAVLEQQVIDHPDEETRAEIRKQLAKLQREIREIRRIDYFRSPQGEALGRKILRVQQGLAVEEDELPPEFPVDIETLRKARWVTRPRPHVDRLACAWLIRRYINAEAEIRYADHPQPGEVPFDMTEGKFRHIGNQCTFESMLHLLVLKEPGLASVGEMVHEIDLQDGLYSHAEVQGLEAVMRGWLQLDLTDTELEMRGLALFDGLLATVSSEVSR